jgi:thioredoxin reductase
MAANRREFIKQSSAILLTSQLNSTNFYKNTKMTENTNFDVIIVGGSYSGLQAAMSLGRALRKVLVIDSGKPCNIQTPYSHNFITQDGKPPKEIVSVAKAQLEKYKTVEFCNDLAIRGIKTENGFEIETELGKKVTSKKLIFATGVKDIMPTVGGFAECWGISVIHCPYCHGYEYSHDKTGILANGDTAFEMGKLINNWTKDLTIFTNGASTLTADQTQQLEKHSIKIAENEIESFDHKAGQIEQIVFKNGSKASLKALYARPAFEQHCPIPSELGCELTELNHLKVDMFQKTKIAGLYACGDNTTMMRAVANAVAQGAMAGAVCNRELIEEEF